MIKDQKTCQYHNGQVGCRLALDELVLSLIWKKEQFLKIYVGNKQTCRITGFYNNNKSTVKREAFHQT